MCGCVSVSACCNNIDTLYALIIGFVGAIIYKSAVDLLHKLEIDDPLRIVPIHGFCGLWGLLATGIFDRDKGLFMTGKFN